MKNKRKLLAWGWLLICLSIIVLAATLLKIHLADIFGFLELCLLIISVLVMIYGFTFIHTVKYSEEHEQRD